jgi:hypothetical protein
MSFKFMIAAPPWLAAKANQRMVNKSFQIRSNGLTLATRSTTRATARRSTSVSAQ